jgi:hypothetical protein
MTNSNHRKKYRLYGQRRVGRDEYFVAYDEMKIEVMDEERKAFDPIAIAFVVRQTLVRVLPPFITEFKAGSNIHFMH